MKYVDTVHSVVRSLQSDATGWLQDLVRIPSVTGAEAPVQEYMARLLQSMRLEVDSWRPTRADLASHRAFSDDGLPLGDRPVVVARLRGTDPAARSLILNGHADVVPPGDEGEWTDGPWSGTVRDGRLYGRGSCDMKGGLVSGILALAALQKMDAPPRGDVILQSVIGEETGGAGTLAAVIRGYRASAAIVLEPTRLNICPTGAGAASFRLHVPGRAAHGAMRREGVSAVDKFFIVNQALSGLEWARHAGFRHPLFREGELVAPISIGRVYAGDWPSTVPETLIAEGRFGILPGENMNAAHAEFETAIQRSAQTDSWLAEHPPNVEWFEGQFEPADTPLDAPVIAALREAHGAVCGAEPAVHGVPYGSDLRFFTNHAGMHAVLYGPGDVALAHSMNESVPIEEVLQAAETVALMILHW